MVVQTAFTDVIFYAQNPTDGPPNLPAFRALHTGFFLITVQCSLRRRTVFSSLYRGVVTLLLLFCTVHMCDERTDRRTDQFTITRAESILNTAIAGAD